MVRHAQEIEVLRRFAFALDHLHVDSQLVVRRNEHVQNLISFVLLQTLFRDDFRDFGDWFPTLPYKRVNDLLNDAIGKSFMRNELDHLPVSSRICVCVARQRFPPVRNSAPAPVECAAQLQQFPSSLAEQRRQ